MIKLTLTTLPNGVFNKINIPKFPLKKMNDYNARQLRGFVERNGIQQQTRSKLIRNIKFEMMSANDPRDMMFTTDSQDGKREYYQILRFFDAKVKKPTNKKEIIDLLNESDIGIYCSCPSFLYWGAAYKANRMGYGIVQENRAPKEPHKEKKDNFYLCKHGQALLRAMPFWWPKIMKEYVEYFKKETEKNGGDFDAK